MVMNDIVDPTLNGATPNGVAGDPMWQRAQATIDEIAALFEDDELRHIYLQSAWKKLESLGA